MSHTLANFDTREVRYRVAVDGGREFDLLRVKVARDPLRRMMGMLCFPVVEKEGGRRVRRQRTTVEEPRRTAHAGVAGRLNPVLRDSRRDTARGRACRTAASSRSSWPAQHTIFVACLVDRVFSAT